MEYSDKINFVIAIDKNILGDIQMTTKTFEQFDVMTDEALANIEGGVNVANEGGSEPYYYGIIYCRPSHNSPWPWDHICK
ncbi:bacteriocin class II family protein [Streptococcus gallolyticus subsp. gallolyticus]|uniref:bacteriocin class II family protein n=1 Tax=Streptococcus gallolyticus TaxID=315405 RepID=UPI0020983B4A|nr:bacteriocin class II family protein [Streptococcus gallolyticus]MCO7178783.1 bacteriocin class II family protein [Streptococcus gallolyticus]